MNNVILTGRLTKDPEVRYTPSGTAVARFTVAVNRTIKDKEGNYQADFPSIVAFGKNAEFVEKFAKKGQLFGIIGQLRTGSYENSEGKKVYTTDVMVERMEFMEKRIEQTTHSEQPGSNDTKADNLYTGFSKVEDDIPF